MAEHSLKKRYFAKVAANMATLIINVGIQAIIPRGLGPKFYGDYNFLTNSFSQLISLFEMGSSQAFFTKLSQRQKETPLISFYFAYTIVMIIALLIFVSLSVLAGISNHIWPGQYIIYIYCAALVSFLIWWSQVVSQMLDAYGLTLKSEAFKVLHKLISLCIIVGLFITHYLSLLNFFIYNFLILAILIVGSLYILRGNEKQISLLPTFDLLIIKKYIMELSTYCHPILIYTLVGAIAGFFDRWLLQLSGGSTQQGFYGLSYQIASICFIFSSALTPLLQREFSIAHAANDIDKMNRVFRRYVPPLFSLAAFFSCFLAVEAKNVVEIFGGKLYSAALPSVMLMAFYPIHQTYGQFCGTYFFATSATGIYRNIGVVMTLIGALFTYFIIAPRVWGGFNLGSLGLAVKTVVVNLVGVNVLLYYNAKFLRFSFIKYVSHQFIIISSLVAVAITTKATLTQLFNQSLNPLISLLCDSLVYSTIIMIMINKFPMLFGLYHSDIDRGKSLITEYLGLAKR